MRVIAGSAGRLKLVIPKGDNTRPTGDKIKETLFNMLNFDLYDKRFLDLFAGSGGIGIEALSRGASFCTFIENNKEASSCIKTNLETTKFSHKSGLLFSDVLSGLKSLSGRGEESFDFIFMDPPYNKGLEKEILDFLYHTNLICETTTVIAEMSKEALLSFEDIGFELIKVKEYKTSKHVFLRRKL